MAKKQTSPTGFSQRLPLPTETEFQSQILQALNAPGRPTRFWRQNTGTVLKRDERGRTCGVFRAGAPTGAADLTGIAGPDGLRIEVEVKVKARWTKAQQQWEKIITGLGGIYLVVRYDPKESTHWNVTTAVSFVDNAIEERRRRRRT